MIFLEIVLASGLASLVQTSLPRTLAQPGGGVLGAAKIERLERRLSAYQALVRQYRSGDREPAIRALDEWTDFRLIAIHEDLAQLRFVLDPGGSVPSSRWDVDDIRAAVLLQTERALVYVLNGRRPTGARSYASHLEIARLQLECVNPAEAGWAAFRLEWWRVLVPLLQRGVGREALRMWALRAVELYPNDAQVRLNAGTPFEIALRSGWGPPPEISSDPTEARKQFLRRRADLAGGEDVRFALLNLNAAIRLAPHLAEARLRRGRAFQLSGQEERAIADFRDVLRNPDSPSPARHLAHILLGSVHQTAQPPRLDEARQEYEAALQEAPLAQSARLALSSVLLLMGDREGAETMAQETLEFPSENLGGAVIDPWSTYGMGQYPQALGAFSRLRTDLWKKQP